MARNAPPRIAHGFGNSRELVRIALESDIDAIEADVRLRNGTLWLEHDRRLPFLPVLFGRRPPRRSLPGALSFPPGPWHLHFDRHPLRLEELLTSAAGRRRLVLDLKQPRPTSDVSRFVEKLVGLLRRFQLEEETCLCGDWPLLDEARRQESGSARYYSVADHARWRLLVRRLDGGEKMDGVSLRSALFDGQSAAYLREKGARVLCWPVDDRVEAKRVLELGAGGIISYDLTLLGSLNELLPNGKSSRQGR
jgi:glycerophosphoryl diester phosphodiesterase